METDMTTTNKLANLIVTEIAATESKAFADMTLAASRLPQGFSTTEKAIKASLDLAVTERAALGEDISANDRTNWKDRIGASRAFLVQQSFGVNEPRIIALTGKERDTEARKAAGVLNDAFLAARKAASVLNSASRLADVPSEHGRKVYLRTLAAKADAFAPMYAKDKEGKATQTLGRELVTLQTETGLTAFLAAMYAEKAPKAPEPKAPEVQAPAPKAETPKAPEVQAPEMQAPASVTLAPKAPVTLAPAPVIKGQSDRAVQDVPAIRDRAAFNAALAQVVAYALAHKIDILASIKTQMGGQAKRKAAELPGEL
jgi:hypothetical protein